MEYLEIVNKIIKASCRRNIIILQQLNGILQYIFNRMESFCLATTFRDWQINKNKISLGRKLKMHKFAFLY